MAEWLRLLGRRAPAMHTKPLPLKLSHRRSAWLWLTSDGKGHDDQAGKRHPGKMIRAIYHFVELRPKRPSAAGLCAMRCTSLPSPTEPALDVRFSHPSSRCERVPQPVVHPVTDGHPHESRSGREPGPADRARRRAVAIPGSPPGRRPETLAGEEFVHRGDLGVVAGEGELGQAPGVLDGPQHGVVVVGDVADEVAWPAG